MSDHQDNKALALKFYDAFEATPAARIGSVIESFVSPEYAFRGVHPFNELQCTEAVVDTVWRPLLTAFTGLQRRQDIFMAGTNEIDGKDWVISMGNLMGLFDCDWLGIPSTGKIVLLPYTEFHRIDDGRIQESAYFWDIISVMKQAGLSPLPVQTGAEIINPGPQTHDGLLFDVQAESETAKTLALVNQMKEDWASTTAALWPAETVAKTWHPNMSWYGPSGIGASYTIDGYLAQHEDPFRSSVDKLTFNAHVCRFAEGSYAGWFGWPNLTMIPKGGLMGLPGSGKQVEMRVVDMYRRDGDKLAENWIFIDLLHWLAQQGVDVLGRMQSISRTV